MSMHAASVNHSARLRRVLNALHDGYPHSTLDLVRDAGVCAVNSIVAELRQNGYAIDCQRVGDVWYYTLQSREAKRA